MKPRVITWDWREQPDWSNVKAALRHNPSAEIFEVDTHSDCYAIVIASEMTLQEAQAYYNAGEWDY